jgi:hypothetical protein
VQWLRATRLSEEELARRGIRAAEDLGRNDPLWPSQLSILAALLLWVFLPSRLSPGPDWPVPVAEGVLLLVLIVISRRSGPTRARRAVAIATVLLAIVADLVALGLLVHYLLAGGQAKGTDLIGGGVVIWTTALLLFTVLYWELDRGGPIRIPGRAPAMPDFLFQEMTDDGQKYVRRDWQPNYVDYLYLSLTNQSAFSPTDTMPITTRAKLLMGVQGTAALVTVGIIVARAVNILGS